MKLWAVHVAAVCTVVTNTGRVEVPQGELLRLVETQRSSKATVATRAVLAEPKDVVLIARTWLDSLDSVRNNSEVVEVDVSGNRCKITWWLKTQC